MPGFPIITTKDLVIGYRQGRQEIRLGDPLELALFPGFLTAVLGPNGVGKSTLLRTLAGLQKPLAGEIWLKGDSLDRLSMVARAQKMSVVLSGPGYTGHLRVYATVAMGRYPHSGWWGNLRQEDHHLIEAALEACRVSHLANRFLETLSDGERQKVMIARALAQDSGVMILDEPTAHLDLPNRVEIMQLLRELCRRENRSILVSTHDLELALQVADRIWLMSGKDGVRVGAPEDLALEGSLGAVFSRDGLKFDVQAGGFRIESGAGFPLVLEGQGVMAEWTRKALIRGGYQIVTLEEKPEAFQVVCPGEKHQPWLIAGGNSTKEVHSIAELMDALGEWK